MIRNSGKRNKINFKKGIYTKYSNYSVFQHLYYGDKNNNVIIVV